MAGQGNAAPVIIKRKKIVQGGGHHGGAWKVAYADFVTAMMAFFMLMWLLNATTEKQRKGIADYFNPTIPVNRVSGGGDGAFGGDSTFTENTLAQNGTGATAENPTEAKQARGETGTAAEAAAAAAAEQQAMAEVEQALSAKGGESATMERLLRHVVTRVTDEGLVIEIFDLEGTPLFDVETATPTPQTVEIAALLAEVLALATNDIAVNGHVRSYPVTLVQDPTWDLSTARAQVLRQILETQSLPTSRIARITGHADRKPVTADPTALRNNRIEIILLRKNR
jgi:chemotaxis protein MotB